MYDYRSIDRQHRQGELESHGNTLLGRRREAVMSRLRHPCSRECTRQCLQKIAPELPFQVVQEKRGCLFSEIGHPVDGGRCRGRERVRLPPGRSVRECGFQIVHRPPDVADLDRD